MARLQALPYLQSKAGKCERKEGGTICMYARALVNAREHEQAVCNWVCANEW